MPLHFFGNFCKKICHQNVSKVAQSGLNVHGVPLVGPRDVHV